MSVSPKAQEPSIDEILDSIRRIIADEDLAIDMSEEVNRAYKHPAAVQASPQLRSGVQPDRRHAEEAVPVARVVRPQVSGADRGVRYAPVSSVQSEPALVEPRYRSVEQTKPAARVVNPPVREPEPRRQSGLVQKPAREPARQEGYGAEARPSAGAGGMNVARQPNSSPSKHGDDRMENTVPPVFGGNANVRPRASAAPQSNEQQATDVRAPLPRRDLLSPAVDAAVSAAFQSLGDLVLPQHERTVEDLVKEILRPMLKEWLDQNLAGIVERLVRAEIERVTGNIR